MRLSEIVCVCVLLACVSATFAFSYKKINELNSTWYEKQKEISLDQFVLNSFRKICSSEKNAGENEINNWIKMCASLGIKDIDVKRFTDGKDILFRCEWINGGKRRRCYEKSCADKKG